ncbi:hypothetical protein CCUS01_07681 [Colletotrichum cuscutae]|uniref:Uncharacterized protein n=1 Tax=Colletotrichum cuscutae TaxID=1209917 RepID=A0AAI9XYA9_9PEZI|nr:hypothetical protein CCUS01_07681 [Colletotrichum cuscutae]
MSSFHSMERSDSSPFSTSLSDWKSNSTAAYSRLRRGQLGALFRIIVASLTCG